MADWNTVLEFENTIAEHCGSKYALACDSNSNALRLTLKYLSISSTDITIPKNTYVSVPNQIILSGNKPVFKDIEWLGYYRLGNTPIVDSATLFGKNIYLKNSYQILSFHFKKILNIGKGGMILTNDKEFIDWARPMIYDGRHIDKMYTDDEFECIGWHMYMTPEDAYKGLEIFNNKLKDEHVRTCGSSWTYKDLTQQTIFKDYL